MSERRDRVREQFAEALDRGHGEIDVGDMVLCDVCDCDLTDDPRSGGFVFGSIGYGPRCAAEGLASIHRYNEERFIRAVCPPGMSYADFIRDYRGGNNTVIVRS